MNRDWVEKDFYRTLGVGKDASADEVKRAYRKLAQVYHPDANPDSKEAEDKFKDISEAYATLSDQEQRKEYDEVRRLVESGGFRGFGGAPGGAGQRVRVEDLSDLLGGMGGLGDLFGGFGGRSGVGPQRGADLSAEIHLSFEEAVRGVDAAVNVRGEDRCTRCGGSGAEPGTSVTTCPTCGGSGMVAQNQGMFSFTQPCPQCRGGGRLIEQPCAQCRGRGTEVRARTVKVRVPAGVKSGAVIRLKGRGEPGRNGGPAGDLLITTHAARHPIFGRRGDDLTVKVPVTFSEAALGARVEVPTLNGSVMLKVPPGTTAGRIFRIRGKGVDRGRGRPGDLLATVELLVPQKLPSEARKLLEQFQQFEPQDPRADLRL
jgi:molecular chaperone DnaJ